ncbi:MAG: acetyl-CoA C-acetyltransferase [Clostridiales Family XIII bacterium]|jgi:acetyl-CoA C-acetyltransferase|nr:acetyl-CoA C-acetyltransferase [Clostridiales Family XIII bacterium]
MSDVVIVEACRTAVGRIGGTLKSVPPEELARVVIQGILDRSGIEPAEIDEVILGHCRQSSDNPNIARLSMLRTAIPIETSAYTVMRQCASGLTAVNNGLMSIQAGQCEVVLAGGTESMSTAPFYMRGARFGLGTGNALLLDSLVEVQPQSQPQEIFGSFNMGVTAENVAEQYKVSRADQDKFALQSQKRALAAIAAGRFKDEIVPVVIPQRKGDAIVFDTDEYPRDTTIEALTKLKAVFKEGGSVTAGNASGRNDGASAVLLMTAEKAAALGMKPLARFVGIANAGVDPRIMGIAPIAATRKALEKAGLRTEDIGLVELNEAFAAQSLACVRELGFSQDIVNVNGGAIALGHPVGSSGCRILVTLIHEMRKRGVRYGLATLCIAGGLGMADVVELL